MKVNLFTPYPAQREFIESYADSEHLFGVLVSPRGAGKTLLAINLTLYWALKRNNSKIGILHRFTRLVRRYSILYNQKQLI
jgi:superfamily II DNA or RNA helicase